MTDKARERLHQWTTEELEDVFYDALLRDARSENYTAGVMRLMAARAAMAVRHAMAGRR